MVGWWGRWRGGEMVGWWGGGVEEWCLLIQMSHLGLNTQ